MSESEPRPTGNVFRCDYCGQWRLRSQAMIFWARDYNLDLDTTVWTPSVFCSDFCGRHGDDTRVGG